MRWLRLLPLVLIVGFGVLWALPPSGLDFAVYWGGGRDVLAGLSPYRPLQSLPFTYPPFAALFFVPFALLPQGVAYVVWQVVALLALVVATLVVAERAGLDSRTALWLTAAGMLVQPVVRDVQLGQVNTVIMVMVVLDLFVVPRRYRGILLGIAAGIKLVPAAFAVLFLLRREWGSAVRAVAAGAATVALPLLVMPNDTVLYWTKLIFDPSRIGGADYGDNQSLAGVVARLVGGKPSTLVTAPIEVAALMVACLLAWRLLREGDEAGGVPAVALGGLLASPISWSHHWVWVVPAVCWLWARRRRVAAGAVMAVTLATHLFLPESSSLPSVAAQACYALLPALGVVMLALGFAATRPGSRVTS
jgi:alpha-1,2-mannosyltransferase